MARALRAVAFVASAMIVAFVAACFALVGVYELMIHWK